MKTLERFWHWADNEKPGNDLFEDKAVAKGVLSDDAQWALDKAAYVLSLRLEDCVLPSANHLRARLKDLSFAILKSWDGLPVPERELKAQTIISSFDFSTAVVHQPAKLPESPVWVPVSFNDAKQSLDVVRHPIKDDRQAAGVLQERYVDPVISDRMASVIQTVVGQLAKSIDGTIELLINQKTGVLLLHDGHNKSLSYALHYNHLNKVEIKRACDDIADQRAAWKAKQVGP